MTDVIVEDPSEVDLEPVEHVEPGRSHRLAYGAVVAIVVAMAALTGWLGFRAYDAHRALEQRELFLQVGRQGAVNLTTIDFAEADADVQRILDSSTGGFRDDFATRSKPFVDTVKQTRSKTVGTVIEAGLESSSATGAQVLVAVNVQTSNSAAPQQEPRSWRMRLTVEKTDDGARVSAVEFVA